MHRRSLFALFGSAACVAACFFDLPDPRPAASADAAPPPDGDTTDHDAGTGGRDAEPDADAGPCPFPRLFCDDFDHGGFGATWSGGVNTTSGATMAQDSKSSSPPFSARAQIPAGSSTQKAFLEHVVPLDDRGIRVEMNVWIEELGTTENYAIVAIFFEPSDSGQSQDATVFVDDQRALIAIQRPAFSNYAGPKIPPGQWVRIRFDAAQRTTGGYAVLSTIEGGAATEIVRVDGLAYDVKTTGMRRARIELGLARYDLQTPALDVRYDDVTVEPVP